MYTNPEVNKALDLREERGENMKALTILLGVRQQAAASNDRLSRVEALEQMAVCYQHAYDQDQDARHLEKMRSVCEEGLELARARRPGKIRAWPNKVRIFHYRLGHVLLAQDDYQNAAKAFERAIRGLKPSDSQYPEFASYYGLALGLYGIMRGEQLLHDALGRAQAHRHKHEKTKDWPYWHGLIKESGIVMRLARLEFVRRGRTKSFDLLMRTAKAMAANLRRHGFKHRLTQYRLLEKQLRDKSQR